MEPNSTLAMTSFDPLLINYTNQSVDCANIGHKILNSKYYQITVFTMYLIVFVVSFFGNTMVCYTVHAIPKMHTVTNYFIANLALGDALMAVFCVPFTAISTFILQYWPFGSCLCLLVNYFQAVSVLVSAYTLVAISFDRYLAIMAPLRPRVSKPFLIIACVWTFALITAVPIALHTKLVQPAIELYKICNRYICQEQWPSEMAFHYYNLSMTTLQFIIPVIVLIFTYIRIALTVWCNVTPGEAENLRDQRMQTSKRKMVKMMVIVVAVYIACWMPLNLFWNVLVSLDQNWPALPYVWFAFHWLAMSHTCYNPIIYCFMNARFRTGFLLTLAKVPLFKWCLPSKFLRNRSSTTGYALTGIDNEHSLNRVNTCSTYISLRQKTSSVRSSCRSSNNGQLTVIEPFFRANQMSERHNRTSTSSVSACRRLQEEETEINDEQL